MIDAMVYAWTWIGLAWLALSAALTTWIALNGRAINRRHNPPR